MCVKSEQSKFNVAEKLTPILKEKSSCHIEFSNHHQKQTGGLEILMQLSDWQHFQILHKVINYISHPNASITKHSLKVTLEVSQELPMCPQRIWQSRQSSSNVQFKAKWPMMSASLEMIASAIKTVFIRTAACPVSKV